MELFVINVEIYGQWAWFACLLLYLLSQSVTVCAHLWACNVGPSIELNNLYYGTVFSWLTLCLITEKHSLEPGASACSVLPEEVHDEICAVESVSIMPADDVLTGASASDLLPSATADHSRAFTTAAERRSSKRKSACAKSSWGRKRKQTAGPVYICPVCQGRVEDPDASMLPDQYSIMCDQCQKWYHWAVSV